jgi:predicted outer membrane repeat protein
VRDIEAYETILSGDLSGNDGPDFANNGDNSYHVANCSNTDANTVLDGVSITAGNADSSSSISDGGGVLIQAGSPAFNNCTFIGNMAQDNGGGIATYSGYPSPKMNNCMFIGNSAGNDGGGFGCGHSEPTLINCTFTGNSADGDGGGICSFGFGAILTVKNCILWDNIANEGPEIALKSFEGSTFVNYSCLLGGERDIYTNSSDLVWGEGNIGEDFINDDPLFVDADNGDCHLKSEAGRWNPVSESWGTDGVTSPCIDAGNPGCDLGDEPVDVNNVRINMGAYGGTNKASKTPVNWASLADLTNDHKVDFTDWEAFAAYWMDGGYCIPSDLDRNEAVNLLDINLFTNEWLWEK